MDLEDTPPIQVIMVYNRFALEFGDNPKVLELIKKTQYSYMLALSFKGTDDSEFDPKAKNWKKYNFNL